MGHGKVEPLLPERRVKFMETGDTAAKHPFSSTKMLHRELGLMKEGFKFPCVTEITIWQPLARWGEIKRATRVMQGLNPLMIEDALWPVPQSPPEGS